MKVKSTIIASLAAFSILAVWAHLSSGLPGYFQWKQTSWAGGANTSANASHASNRTNWTRYNSADPNIVISDNKVTLSPLTIQVPGFNSFNDASAVLNNVEVTSGGSVKLRAVKSDGFAKNLREWRSQPAIPAFGPYSSYARMDTMVNSTLVGFIYILTGSGDGRQFGRIKIRDASDPNMLAPMSAPKWEFLAPLPVPAAAGCVIAGDGEYIYALRGGGSKQVYRYQPSADGTGEGTWTKLPDISQSVLYGARMVATGPLSSGGTLYAVTGGSTYGFYCYKNAGVSWNTVSSTNDLSLFGKAVYHGSGMAYYPGNAGLSIKACLYLAPGSYEPTLLKFELPVGGTPGNWSIASASVDGVTSTSPYFAGTRCGVWYPGGKYLYAILGRTYLRPFTVFQLDRGFYRYGPIDGSATAIWTRLDDLPGAPDTGIIYDPYPYVDNHTEPGGPSGYVTILHYLNTSNYTRAWKFDITSLPATSHWKTLSQRPYSTAYSAGRGYCYWGTYMYYVSGNNTKRFFRYSIDGNTWEQLPDVPSAINYSGNKLARIASAYLFCLPGNKSSKFYKYRVTQNPATASWDTDLPDFPWKDSNGDGFNDLGNGAGIVGVENNSKDYIYALRGTGTKDFYKYSGADGWVAMPDAPANINNSCMYYTGYQEQQELDPDGITVKKPAGSYVYVMAYTTTTKFYKYGPMEYDTDDFPSTNAAWFDTGTPPPCGMDSGSYTSSMAAAGASAASRNVLYYTPGWEGASFYKYEVDTNTWTRIDSTPFTQYHNEGLVGTDKAIYMLTYYEYTNTFWKYDPETNKWNDPVLDQYFTSGGNLTQDSNKNIYLIGATASYGTGYSHFWVYSPDKKRWTGLFRAPFVLQNGTKGAYLAADNAIYLARGFFTKQIYKYDIGQSKWYYFSDGPELFRPGNQLVAGPNSTLYCSTASSGNIYVNDTTNPGAWSTLFTRSSSWFSDNCDAMAYKDGFLYIIRPTTSEFYRLNTADPAGLDGLKKVGDEVGDGSSFINTTATALSLSYPGSGSYLYCIPALNEAYFLRYNIDSGLWERLTKLPIIASSNMSGVVSGGAGDPFLYAFNAGFDAHFLRYDSDPTGNTWDESSYLPVPMTAYSSVCGYKGYVYYIPGGTTNFYRYCVQSGIWENLSTSISSFSAEGVSMLPIEYNGKAYIYATGGSGSTGFYRYSIYDDAWESMTGPHAAYYFTSSSCMTRSGDFIYVLRAGGTNVLMKYALSESPAAWVYDDTFTPAPVGRGSSISCVENYLYFLLGGHSQFLYKYNLSNSTWSSSTCPVAVNNGQSELLYPGFGDYLYYMQGSAWDTGDPAYTFLRYDIKGAGGWQELTPSPFGIYSPGKMVYPGGDNMYIVRGSGKSVFTRYYAFCFGDYTSAVKEIGTHCSWGPVNWTDNGIPSLQVAIRTGNDANMKDAADWSAAVNLKKGDDLGSLSISSINPKHKYIQYRASLSTDDFNNLPALNDISLYYKKYPAESALTSSPYNTGFAINRLRAISWGLDPSAGGAAVRFQLRSTKDAGGSPDAGGWTGWQGPTGTRTTDYNFDYAQDYAYASEVKVDAASGRVTLLRELEDFAYARAITIQNTSATLTTPVNDVCLINITSADAHFWDNTTTKGNDIRFYYENSSTTPASDKQKLKYRIVSFDRQAKTASIAVRLPISISPGGSSAIYMIYGNAKAFSESDSTVRSDYKFKNDTSLSLKGWWDLNTLDLTAKTSPDASTLNNPMILRYFTSANVTTGPFGDNAVYLEGARSYLYANQRYDYRYTGGDRTMSIWLKPDNDPDGGYLMGAGSPYNFRTNYNPAGGIYTYFYNNNDYSPPSAWGYTATKAVPQDGKWHNVVIVMKSDRSVQYYIDGVPAGLAYCSITDWAAVPSPWIVLGNVHPNDYTYRGYYFKGSIDMMSIFNSAFTGSQVKYFYSGANTDLAASYTTSVSTPPPANTYNTGKYYTTNSVIMPIFGFFYNSSDALSSFTAASTTAPEATNIKYQVSPNGYNWYYHNGTSWQLVSGGYTDGQVNTFTDIRNRLSTFTSIVLPSGTTAASGDFYWRAYLHSDGSGTPELRQVSVTATSGVSYYTDKAGAQKINIQNEDCQQDQWIQYKATLYSDGENAPVLNSVMLDYVESKITVTRPAGGEEFVIGADEDITWTSQGLEDLPNNTVRIEYWSDKNNGWETVVAGTTNSGTYRWIGIPSDPSVAAKIRITSVDRPVVLAESNNFKIMGIRVLSPNNRQVWEIGASHDIDWKTYGYPSRSSGLVLQWSVDEGATWTTEATGQEDSPVYPWEVNAPASNKARIKIYDATPAYCYNNNPATPKIIDISDVNFSIIPKPEIFIDAITNINASGDETTITDGRLIAGERYRVYWQTNGQYFAPQFKLQYSKDGFKADINDVGLCDSGAPDGYPEPTAPLAGGYCEWNGVAYDIAPVQLRLVETSVPPNRDTNIPVKSAPLAMTIIEPYFVIDLPAAGETWVSGDSEDVAWTSYGTIQGPFKLEYCLNYNDADPDSSDWQTITESIPADAASYPWTIPAVSGEMPQCRLRITDAVGIAGTSAANFNIWPTEKIIINKPGEGEDLTMGVPYRIMWTPYGKAARDSTNVLKGRLYYSLDNGATYTVIPQSGLQPIYRGYYDWTPNFPNSTTEAKLKLESNDAEHPNLKGETPYVFTIKDPVFTNIWLEYGAAQASAIYATGNYNIRWETYGVVSANIMIEYRIGGGMWQVVTAATTPAEGVAKSKQFTIPDSPASTLELRLTDNDRPTVVKISDPSTILAPKINSISSPAVATVWVEGDKHDITWAMEGGAFEAIRSISVDCIVNGKTIHVGDVTNADDLKIAAGTIKDWVVPGEISQSAVIKVYDPTRAGTELSQTFTIALPSIAVNDPKAGSIWRIGSSGHEIKWTPYGGIKYPLKIYYITSDGTEYQIAEIAADSQDALNYSHPWDVYNDIGGNGVVTPGAAKIVIRDDHTPPIEGTIRNAAGNPSSFNITVPVINVNGPQAGEKWTESQNKDVTWEYDGRPKGSLKIEWIKMDANNAIIDGGVIADGLSTDFKSASWMNIPNSAVGTRTRVRITDGWNAPNDSTVFTIFPIPEIYFDAPVTESSPGVNTVWRIGNTCELKWHDNGGAISNALNIEYSTNGGATWNFIQDESGSAVSVPNSGSYLWTIPPKTSTAASNNAKLRITDTARWRDDLPATQALSEKFEIGLPVIDIISPAEDAYIALGEVPSITWTSDGFINDNLFISLVPSGGGKISIPPPEPPGYHINSHLFTGWAIPATAPIGKAEFEIMDADSNYNGQNVIGTSKKFNIINTPTVTVARPNGGEDYVIDSSTIPVEWSSKGLTVTNVKIEMSADNFASAPYVVVASTPNTGAYNWYIKPDADVPVGTNVRLRVTRLDTVPDYGGPISDSSDAPFTIRSGFVIQSPPVPPAEKASWVTNETKEIRWITKGTISKVKLFYSVDGGATFNPITAAQGADGNGIANTGSFMWEVPNERTENAVIRITDASDTAGIIQNDSAPFKITWYTIRFYIIDKDTFDNLRGLSVGDDQSDGPWAGWIKWSVPTPELNSPVTHEYPYGKYYVTWNTKVNEKTGISDYFERTVEFTADETTATKGFVVEMENRISAQIEWHVILSAAYSAGTDSVEAQAWLERRGILQEPRFLDTNNDTIPDTYNYDDFKSISIAVYDYDNPDGAPLYEYTGQNPDVLPDTKGVYRFKWEHTGLQGGKTYFIKAVIKYGEGLYKSGVSLDVSVPIEHAEQTQKLATVENAVVTAIPAQIEQAAATITSKIDAARTSIETKVDTSTAAIKSETSKILTATGTESLPDKIEAAKEHLTNIAKSEILNRENTVRSGQDLMIRYRTPGGSAAIDVYDAKNIQRVNKMPMFAVPGTESVYEYKLKFDANWGRGDFTIVCSDANGNMDAMIISVLTTSLEDIYSTVSAVLGSTAGMSNFKTLAESLNSQFSVIESALNKASKSFINEGKGAAGMNTALEPVFNQLAAMAKQMKDMSGDTNINLSKLYDLTKEKKSDLTYLKNKTQQLRAAMEMSKKMVDNIANKPVTQTWYEYK